MSEYISSISNNTATSSSTASKTDNTELGKDAFLQLLVAQLANQDPTESSDPTQYITQLSTYSMLEQIQNLNSTMSFSSATNLIGKTVYIDSLDENNNNITGIVENVNKNGSSVFLSLKTDSGDINVNYEEVKGVLDISQEI
ncbi:MAG: flagellar hook assembly protein FlgD [Clostridiaceae bacterium]